MTKIIVSATNQQQIRSFLPSNSLGSLKKQVKNLPNSEFFKFLCNTGNNKKISFIIRKSMIAYTIISSLNPPVLKNSISVLKFFETTLDFYGSYQDIEFWISFSRPASKKKLVKAIAIGCFTVTGIVDNLLTLHNLGVPNLLGLSKYASKVGTICPILLKITQEGLESQLTRINIVGMTIFLGCSTYDLVKDLNHYFYATNDQEKSKAFTQFKKHSLSFTVTAMDLAFTIIPLAVPCGPLVLISFGLASKGTGLLIKLLQSKI